VDADGEGGKGESAVSVSVSVCRYDYPVTNELSDAFDTTLT